MKTNRLQKSLLTLTGITLLFVGARLGAAPLTWFPGPAMDYPGSDAATVVMPGLGNVVIAGTTAYPEGLIATNSNWTPLGQPFYGNLAPGAVVSGGQIIVYGGNNGTSSSSAVISYSPSDGASPLASMNVPRSYLGYAPDHNGNAYAIGGLDDTGQPLSSAEVYNQDSGTWAAIASLPTTLYDFPAVFNHTNYIYTFGGFTDTTSGTETATVLRYSVSANSWTTLAPMLVAVAGSTAALGVDGKIYVVGGTSGGVTTNLVQVYDPAANSWVISTPLPEGLSGSAMGVDSLGRLIVMGGMDTNGNDVGDVWRSQQLGAIDSPPVLTQVPGTNATYLGTYTSSINATGNPQPVYVLVSGPPNLTVDYFSGQISWTPQGLGQIGAIPVTVAATNYAGSTNWSFTITVPNPPPVTPANLYLAGATESSVTLAWAPEDSVAGSVTYNVFIPHPYHSPRGSGGGVNYQLIGSTTSTNFTISGLTPNTSYTFDVNATGPGGTSGYAGIGITTLGPLPPSNLRVIGITSTSISLAWNPSPGPVPIARYEILGWVGGLFPTISYGTNFTGTTATVTGLKPGTYEEWSMRAYDAAGNVSGFAPGIYAVNPVPASVTLSQPAALSALTPGSGGFQFSVQASAVETTYVQATTNMADPASWVTIATNPPGSSFIFTDTDTNVYPARFYRVMSP
ncbi:MAG TPA: kelch repeat-containing protein [Verrucomicrobiae bacterium]|nr:kelch repeat-containing protein [Verrucomicrobiae bacterium]